MSDSLKMTFDPGTIKHLGLGLYSTLPPVLAELIANSYDADAEYVILTLNDSGDEKEIIIEDDGMGMSFEEINDKFLRIGRDRRQEEEKQITPKGRKVIGKKGLGKLSFFGIAHEIEITTRKDGKENTFRMSWGEIEKESNKGPGKVYEPEVVKRNENCSLGDRGTKIFLREIQRDSKFSPEDIANRLTRMFILDPDFQIEIRYNDDKPILVDDKRRYAGLEKEVEWAIPGGSGYESDYDKADQITGQLIATKKPIQPNTKLRGITLFSRKKMVNEPGYFSNSVSSHFFSYLTGWLEVDFIDDLEDDVITTARQSLNWEHNEMEKLQRHLQGLIKWLERDWREKRKQAREKEISEKTGIDIQSWLDKTPEDIRQKIMPVLEAVVRQSELPEEVHTKVVKNIYDIVPEYPRYHWRHLHDEIKDASESGYQKADYYKALQEAIKRYVAAVREKSEQYEVVAESAVMSGAFGIDADKISVAKGFKKPGGGEFSNATISNVENGQKHLSMGIIAGHRNVLNHVELNDLKVSGLFTEKDCLDGLSLLSHLFRRLDGLGTEQSYQP